MISLIYFIGFDLVLTYERMNKQQEENEANKKDKELIWKSAQKLTVITGYACTCTVVLNFYASTTLKTHDDICLCIMHASKSFMNKNYTMFNYVWLCLSLHL